VKMFHLGGMCDISGYTLIVLWHQKRSLGFTDSYATQPFSFSSPFLLGSLIRYLLFLFVLDC